MIGYCRSCKSFGKLTKHSLVGGHQSPFIWICEKCHQKIHGIVEKKTKINKKVQKGTYHKRKKKK